jgi:hypothetical protein
MSTTHDECTKDAMKNLSESHKDAHTHFMAALVMAESEADLDQRHHQVQVAKEHLLNAYHLADEAYKAEIEACKATYPK